MGFDCSNLVNNGMGWFVAGWLVALIDCIYIYTSIFEYEYGRMILALLFSVVVYGAVWCFSKDRQIDSRAVFLGIMAGLGLIVISFSHQMYRPFGMYVLWLSWFHFSEYLFTAMCNPKHASISSFMLYHSTAYILALIGSVTEFFIECNLCPDFKMFSTSTMVIGSMLCLFGELLRKRAMWVAGTNFNHIVQDDLRSQDHELITHDVYESIQHPSYSGWFCFTIGTQVILSNPVCLVVFAVVMRIFFLNRIQAEELALSRKHTNTYTNYTKITPRFFPCLSGLPQCIRYVLWCGKAQTVPMKD